MLNRHLVTGTEGAGLVPHFGLCVGAIQLRNTEDCFNSDLFNGKFCKTQLFVIKTRSVFEAYHASSANKEENGKNVLLYVR